jgi:hypothetical protein
MTLKSRDPVISIKARESPVLGIPSREFRRERDAILVLPKTDIGVIVDELGVFEIELYLGMRINLEAPTLESFFDIRWTRGACGSKLVALPGLKSEEVKSHFPTLTTGN